jgi:flagellar protein FlgJ
MNTLTGAQRKTEKSFAEHLSENQDAKPMQAGKGNPAREKELARLKDVSEQLESLMLNMMLKSMRANIGKTKFIHGGMAEDVFEDMLYEQYSEKMARSESFGISELVYEQLSRYV